jgi:eukaryotic-like serine/threonine-protein kinase
VLAVAAGVAAVVIGLVGWQLLQGGGQSHKNVRAGSVNGGGSSTPDQGVVQLTPAGASGFDANPQDHPDTAVGNAAQSALVGHGPARWHSQTYKDARFGMLKSGIGLLIDMGSPVTLNRVHVNVPSASGPGTLELRIGDAPSSLDSLKQVGVADSAAGPVDIAASQGARGRYILLWFTKLPGVGGGFRAQLAGVSVYGRQG